MAPSAMLSSPPPGVEVDDDGVALALRRGPPGGRRGRAWSPHGCAFAARFVRDVDPMNPVAPVSATSWPDSLPCESSQRIQAGRELMLLSAAIAAGTVAIAWRRQPRMPPPATAAGQETPTAKACARGTMTNPRFVTSDQCENAPRGLRSAGNERRHRFDQV